MGKVHTSPGGGGGKSDECTATKAMVLAGYKAVTSDSGDEAAEGTLTVQSVVNFKAAQYSNLTLIATWARPSKGPWSGVRIMCKQGSYPSSVSDGTLFHEGSGTSATKALASGTWYFRAWNYITTNQGRIYGGYVSATCANDQIKGQQVITASGTFTVPAGVRSIDIFCVGGGGGGGSGQNPKNSVVPYSSGLGGSGGYTRTVKKQAVSPGQQLAVVIGAGGAGGRGNLPGSSDERGEKGKTGGTTSVGNIISALGGGGGGCSFGGSGGGSGGGGSATYSSSLAGTGRAGNGGSDGSNGKNGGRHSGLPGQGTTTRAFGESAGTLYAGGGGGGSGMLTAIDDNDNGYVKGCAGVGGAGGGGKGCGKYTVGASGNVVEGDLASVAGTPGTGGGGGGAAAYTKDSLYHTGAKGGSGVCIIRWGY